MGSPRCRKERRYLGTAKLSCVQNKQSLAPLLSCLVIELLFILAWLLGSFGTHFRTLGPPPQKTL